MKSPTRNYCWIFMMSWWVNWFWKFCQKNPKNVWSAIVPGYLGLFIFVYVLREIGSNREMKPKWFQWRLWLMFCIILLCLLAREQTSSTVQVVGKFWSLHNPQKLCMCQISYKNYILGFPEDYLRLHKHCRI